MRKWTQWQDHVTEFEDRYTETQNADGTITHTPVTGKIIQQGTPQNEDNFNSMEDGITNAGELAALMAIERIHTAQMLEDISGETITVTLTNSQQYPFNNSKKTVALQRQRNHLNYTVTAEIQSVTGGFVKSVEITEKLVNGFKVEFDGSAAEVVVKLYVKGGFY